MPHVAYRHYGKREGTIAEWRIGPKPIVPEPCRCERPIWFRDEISIRCLICAKRRRLRVELPE